MFEGIKKKIFTQEFLEQNPPSQTPPQEQPVAVPQQKVFHPKPTQTVTVTLEDESGVADTEITMAPLSPEADQEMKDKIYALLAKLNKEGIDFFEVWDATEQMDGGICPANIKNAFTVLKAASGGKLTKEYVLETADFYKSQIQAALDNDTKAKKADKLKLAGQLASEKSQLQQEVDDLTKQIEDLAAQKEKAEASLLKIDGKYNPTIQKIEQKIAAGSRAVLSVSQEIQSFVDIFTKVVK